MLVVRERQLARKLEQRVVVLADDVGAQLRVTLHALPVGRRELLALSQNLRGHAQLADVMQRRREHHHLGDLRLRTCGLRDEPCIVPKAHHAVSHGGALVQLHGARQAPDELGAGAFELRGALLHQALELLAPVDQREMQPHPCLEHLGVDRLGDVVHRASVEALDLRLGFKLARQENDRNVRGRGLAFERAAHLEARDVGHLHVAQDEVGLRAGKGFFDRRAGVRCGVDVVAGAERLRHQREQIAVVVDGKDARSLGRHCGAV